MPWMRLIRWKNLAIIFLAQLVAWYCVVLPLSPQALNSLNFLFITVSTLLIAASGYVINDYFDIKIDSINRPEKMVIGNSVSPKKAIIIHSVLNIVALLLAGVVALQERRPQLLTLQLVCTLLLWFYSTKFKRENIIGNIVVALLTALTIITLVIYEPKLFQLLLPTNLTISTHGPQMPLWVLLVYAYFAFMLTWMREITKDMEDVVGDTEGGCSTLPIKMGLKYASRFTLVLAGLVILPLLVASWQLVTHRYYILAGYVFLLLLLPLVYWCLFLPKSAQTAHYKKASRGLKIIMVLGIFSLVVYNFELHRFL